MKKLIAILTVVLVLSLSVISVYADAASGATDADGSTTVVDGSVISAPVSSDEPEATESVVPEGEEVSEVDTETDVSESADDESITDPGVDLMLKNLKYMGLGMLGIFVVIGIVIIITMILNKVTEKK